MKKLVLNVGFILLMSAIIFAVSSIFLNCNSPAQRVENAKTKVDEANKNLDKANMEYMADVENFKKKTADRIAENDKQIADIRGKIKFEKEVDKIADNNKIDALEKKNREMEKMMADYKADGQENWEKFKIEFSNSMDDLGNALKDLVTKKGK